MSNPPQDNSQSGGNGGRSLGGGSSEPLPDSWARPTSNQPRVGRIGQWGSSSAGSGRIAGLSDFSASGPPMVGGGDDDDDDDDDGPEGEPQSFFAGGERSGISVEGPGRQGNNLVKDILKKASRGSAQTVASSVPTSRAFTGGGNTLGSDEVESQRVPDPNAASADYEEETAIRNITFWREGFSIEDGALLRYGVPENDRLLNEINTGVAPPSTLNVRPGQPVELRVARRTEESYAPPPKRPLGTFEGSGQRLGSPVPNIAGAGSVSSQHVPGAFPERGNAARAQTGSIPTTTSGTADPRFEVDFNEPTTSVQVRLADGTRLTARMNLSHTVGDIRNFINASTPGASAQAYTIGTTFPNRTLDDDSATIEKAGLKNCVIVQRLS